MQVTFARLADHQWGHVLIERDDHVVFRMHAGPMTATVPHDLVHFTVEDAMGIADGIWGAIAGGVVFRSMAHVSGRRPPHAAERSQELKRAYRDHVQRAELLAGFVEAAAHRPAADLPRLVEEWFRSHPEHVPDIAAVEAATAALHRAQQRWGALPVGGLLRLQWPAQRRIGPVTQRPQHRRGPRRRLGAR
jgi:hypothetical protein